MNWDARKEAVASSSSSVHGKWCIFVSLSETEGVKFYETKKLRDEAAELQREAAKYGLGPNVGAFCEMPIIQSWDIPDNWEQYEIGYGYITQKADTRSLTDEEFEELIDDLHYHGLSTSDLNQSLNCGIIDGKPVRIDFDPVFYHANSENSLDDYEE